MASSKSIPYKDMSKADIWKLIAVLEGEIEARNMVINILKHDRFKLHLHKKQYMLDPISALHRDDLECMTSSNDSDVNNWNFFDNCLYQYRMAHDRMRVQLRSLQIQHDKVVHELEEETQKHAQDTAQGDDVTYLLEKDRERLKQQLLYERTEREKLRTTNEGLQSTSKNDSLVHKAAAIIMIQDRHRLLQQLCFQSKQAEIKAAAISQERDLMKSRVEGLTLEKSQWLKFEAEFEMKSADFDTESERLKVTARKLQVKNTELQSQLLQQQSAAPPVLTNGTDVSINGAKPDYFDCKQAVTRSLEQMSSKLTDNLTVQASRASPVVSSHASLDSLLAQPRYMKLTAIPDLNVVTTSTLNFSLSINDDSETTTVAVESARTKVDSCHSPNSNPYQDPSLRVARPAHDRYDPSYPSPPLGGLPVEGSSPGSRLPITRIPTFQGKSKKPDVPPRPAFLAAKADSFRDSYNSVSSN